MRTCVVHKSVVLMRTCVVHTYNHRNTSVFDSDQLQLIWIVVPQLFDFLRSCTVQMLMFCWQAGPESVISVSVVFEISASVMCGFSLCGIPFQSSSPRVMLVMWFHEHGVRLSLHDVQFLSIWCVISVLVWFECLVCDFSPCVVWFESVMCDFSPIWFQILWCVIWVSLTFSSYDVGFEAFSHCDVLWCVISVSVAFSPYDVGFLFLWLSVLMMWDFSICGLVLMMWDFSFCGFQSLWCGISVSVA